MKPKSLLDDKPEAEIRNDPEYIKQEGIKRGLFADIPGGFVDVVALGLDYGAEGLQSLLPPEASEALGIPTFRKSMQKPFMGSAYIEDKLLDAGVLRPSTNTQEEMMYRLTSGLIDPTSVGAIGSLASAKPIFTSPALKAAQEVNKKVWHQKEFDHPQTVASEVGFEELPASQWISQLKGRGVTDEELYWTGADEWIKSQEGNISKDNLIDYLFDNQIQIEEVLDTNPPYLEYTVKGGLNPKILKLQHANPQTDLVAIENPKELDKIKSAYDEDLTFIFGGNDFNKVDVYAGSEDLGSYTFDDLEEYYGPSVATQISELAESGGIGDTGEFMTSVKIDQIKGFLEQKKGALDSFKPDIPPYEGGHFGDNTFAHIRFQDRTDADGNKVLFIDEIQGDWGQAGRKKGFDDPDTGAEIDFLNKELQRINKRIVFEVDSRYRNLEISKEERDSLYMPLKSEYDKILNRRDELVSDYGPIPVAPFVQDTNQWTDIALKRMIRYAVEEGYDKISWTPGYIHVDRYGSSAEGLQSFYDKTIPARARKLADKYGAKVTQEKGILRENNPDATVSGFTKEMFGEVSLIASMDLARQAKYHKVTDILADPDSYPDVVYGNDDQKEMVVSYLEGHASRQSYTDILVASSDFGNDLTALEGPDGLPLIYANEGQAQEAVRQAHKQELELGGFGLNDLLDMLDYQKGGDGLHDEEIDFLFENYEVLDKETWTMNITDKMKKAAMEGLPYLAVVPPAAMLANEENRNGLILE